MERNEQIWILQKLQEECRKEHLDSEAEALAAAVYNIGIVDEMKKQRDAMIDILKEYDDTDLVKAKYIRQVLGDD